MSELKGLTLNLSEGSVSTRSQTFDEQLKTCSLCVSQLLFVVFSVLFIALYAFWLKCNSKSECVLCDLSAICLLLAFSMETIYAIDFILGIRLLYGETFLSLPNLSDLSQRSRSVHECQISNKSCPLGISCISSNFTF